VRSFIQDGDVSHLESDLALQAVAIKDQLQLEHTRTTSRAYDAVRSLSAAYKRGKDTENHLRLLNLCSNYNYKAAWKRTRKLGNTDSIFLEGYYHRWLCSRQSASLIIRGKLGSGKSVLLANMVDHVNLEHPKSKTAYFFCCEDDVRYLSCRTIIVCLARQFIQLIPPEKSTNYSHRFWEDMPTSQIVEALVDIMKYEERLILILDGLEACAKQNRLELFGALEHLQMSLNTTVCLSCSIGAGNESERNINTLKRQRNIILPDDRPELRAYVKTRLLEKLENGELCLGDPGLILVIEQALNDGSQGM